MSPLATAALEEARALCDCDGWCSRDELAPCPRARRIAAALLRREAREAFDDRAADLEAAADELDGDAKEGR